MRKYRIRAALVALGTAMVLTAAAGCEGGSSTTGGTSGTTGGTSGGATEVGPPSVNSRILASPRNCYKGGKVTLTIVGESLAEYTVRVIPTSNPKGPAARQWVKTTNDGGGASWTLNCDELPAVPYQVTMTKAKSIAFFDILREQ